MKPRAVECHDAGRLLPPMLQGVEPERGDRGGVGMSEYAEYPALLVRAVVRKIVHGTLGLGSNHDLADVGQAGRRPPRIGVAIMAWPAR